jgi:hypothetical protein
MPINSLSLSKDTSFASIEDLSTTHPMHGSFDTMHLARESSKEAMGSFGNQYKDSFLMVKVISSPDWVRSKVMGCPSSRSTIREGVSSKGKQNKFIPTDSSLPSAQTKGEIGSRSN